MSEDDLTTIKFQRTGCERRVHGRERAGSMADIEADGPLHDVHSTLGLRLECKAPYARNISLSATSRPVLETESGAVATVELPAYEFNHVE